MKQIKGIVDGLKLILKYGAYIGVIINVAKYAIEQLENVDSGVDNAVDKLNK